MAYEIEDIPQQAGGWFKADDQPEGATYLIEVVQFDRQRPTDYGPKDSALTNMTIFDTPEDVAAGTPSSVVTGIRVEQTILARDLGSLVGKATIVHLAQAPSKKPGQKPAWVWRQTNQTVKKGVIAYAQKREAEIQAALDAVPDFE